MKQRDIYLRINVTNSPESVKLVEFIKNMKSVNAVDVFSLDDAFKVVGVLQYHLDMLQEKRSRLESLKGSRTVE